MLGRPAGRGLRPHAEPQPGPPEWTACAPSANRFQAGLTRRATTTSAGCTVTPLKPVFDHLNSSGNKVIRYDTKVYCDAGRSIEILDERRDQDNFSLDDFEGSIIYNHRFGSAATVTESVQAVLPDADSLAEGADKEEMYHAVGFQVTEDNGYVSPWTDWDDSAVVQFHL